MNKWISSFCMLLLMCSLSSATYADIKKTIKNKTKEGVLEEFAEVFTKIPGLKQINNKIKENEYQLISASQNRGTLEIVNLKDVDSITLSRKRYAVGFKMNNEAILASGTYWLKAEPKDNKKQAIEREVIVSNRSKNQVELKFWKEGLKVYPLEIITIPSSAKVRILNIVPKYKFGMPLKQGKYRVEVSNKGYKTRKFNVMLNHNQSNFTAKLEQLSGKKSKASKEVAQSPEAEKAKKTNSVATKVFVWCVFLGIILLVLWLAYRLIMFLLKSSQRLWQAAFS